MRGRGCNAQAVVEPIERRVLLCARGEHVPMVLPQALEMSDTVEMAEAAAAPAPIEATGLGAQATWNVTINDPTSAWAAYHNDIRRIILAAGREWSKLFDSSAAIEVAVFFNSSIRTANGGSATSSFVRKVGNIDIFEQGAAAEINKGIDPNGAAADVIINIGVMPSANYLTGDLWFDPDPAARTAPIPPGKTDAMSVFLHELGHALGYNGWRNATTGQLPGNYASTWDERTYLNGQYTYFNGPTARAVYGSDPAVTYANGGHWGNESPGPGSDLEMQMMNGLVFYKQHRYAISDLDIAVMKDVGLKMEASPPAIVGREFQFNGGHRVVLRFDEPVGASLSNTDLTLRRTGPGDPSVFFSSVMDVAYDAATNTATVMFPGLAGGLLPDGNFELTVNRLGVIDRVGNAMSADVKHNFFVLRGDLNRDGIVSIADFITLASNFNKTGAAYADGDINYDAQVSIADFIDLASRFNQSVVIGAGAAAEVQVSLAAAPESVELAEMVEVVESYDAPVIEAKPAKRKTSGVASAKQGKPRPAHHRRVQFFEKLWMRVRRR